MRFDKLEQKIEINFLVLAQGRLELLLFIRLWDSDGCSFVLSTLLKNVSHHNEAAN